MVERATEHGMETLKLRCAVYGEATVFDVDAALSQDVAALRNIIADAVSFRRHPVAPMLMTLYLARIDGAWLKDDADLDVLLAGEVDTSYAKMRTSWKLSNRAYFGEIQPRGDDTCIHILVRVPDASESTMVASQEWYRSESWRQVQLNLWKSVVRISSEGEFSATALVIDRTDTHVYLLCNLHLWVEANTAVQDKAFFPHLSAAFKRDIQRYLANPRKKGKKPSAAKRKPSNPPLAPSRKSARSTKQTAPVVSDMPQVVIEQLSPSNAMVPVLQFSLDSDVCWKRSATYDYAIFKVMVADPTLLPPLAFSSRVVPSMPVHVFGFPGVLQDAGFGHAYAVNPAHVTGGDKNMFTLSSLSSPGLSGSAIVCSQRGTLLGYLGGGLDSSGNEQYQSYGYTLRGLPSRVPSS